MQSKVRNDLGTIAINNEVIARLAGMAAMECYGVVGMAARSLRDGLAHLLKIESLTKGVRLETIDKGEHKGSLAISLHIIVEYETNITAIAQALIDNVKYKIEDCVGMTVGQVNIFVEGVRI